MARRWTETDVPDLHGRIAVITGGNTGLGFETARVLATRGATVVLACRDQTRATSAAARLPGHAETLHLDLSDPLSVRRAGTELRERHPRVDLLINNAGALQPRHALTPDGWELTLATNHLGPFAFTGLILDTLLPVAGSRIVTVSSIGHRYGSGVINFDDLHAGPPRAAYFQSKLANLMFTYELQRRLTAAGAPTIAVAAHPGNARTEFGRALPRVQQALMSPRLSFLTWWLMQSPAVGALATLRAATDPATSGGDFYGPPGRRQFTGHPELIEPSPEARSAPAQQRLWQESQRLTGITYPLPQPASAP
ncbi:oxidoreductase [Actinoplanes sichuanensis]|uniref:Oxidoreductase n=1 Tax=Actinoplanes sichuanensis TaxID=512349 RepID=A0ABW4A8Z4_9ACTN|nr:oxidoreductase [Actinoplanes sichuanensis]BEL03649.1 oxidoreductase [Actinoplanes sichuanensis]